MAIQIDSSKLGSTISEVLSQFAKATERDLMDSADSGARAALKVLKTTGGYKDRSGDYRGSFRKKKSGFGQEVYSQKPSYRLTHLLEKPHALRDGGKSRAFPHWEPAEREAIEAYTKSFRRKVGK